jgi:hypothetical protein
MFEYRVFGGRVISDIHFPELPKADEHGPTWTLRTVSKRSATPDMEFLGKDEVDVGVSVRLYRSSGGFRLDFDDTGTFDVSNEGSTIEWCPGPGASLDAARLDFLGRVLATALHQQGFLCLHASAIAMPGCAIAFVAPKFHGKSTLALALVSAGAKLVTDDTLPVDLRSPVQALPGVHQLRLWEDSARQVGTVRGSVGRGPGGKLLLTNLRDDQCLGSPVPLDAVYLLSPNRVAARRSVRRRRVAATRATLALVRNAKLGPLLGRSEAVTLFDRATKLAQSVPVYTLRLDRGFTRLREVVAELQDWHGERRHSRVPSSANR